MIEDTRIDLKNIPSHVAIIMDGNGRWAMKHGAERIFGHQNGVKSVRDSVETAAELGVKYLTLYAFSTENWNRPTDEVNALMELLVKTIHAETETLNKNNIRLLAIGDLKSLPGNCYNEIVECMELTRSNNHMNLVIALSYSSKWEITEATKAIARDVKAGKLSEEEITAQTIDAYLCTTGMPEPELLIRTSGEHRISNFLLWQCAYSEFYFTETLWPDFNRQEFFNAIVDYQQRERRFGLTSEQIS
jgi:undecaprenyl diphosphate synthase